jgi:prevent-host-death family protein
MKVELVTTLKRRATQILSDLHNSHDPVLITENGRPSAYLVDVESFDLLQDRIRILEGIAMGEKAIRDGRTFTHSQAKEKMEKWLK